MVKVRLIGTPYELRWAVKQICRNKKINASHVSDNLPVKGSIKLKRVHLEIEKIQED